MTYYDTNNLKTYFGNQAQTKKIKSGEILFIQGQPVDFIYFIDSGKVKAESHTESDESLVLYHAMAGMALAEEHLFIEHYGYTATAEEDTEVRFLKKEIIHQQLLEDPEYAFRFMMCISARHNDLRVHCTLLTIQKAEDRLLAYMKWKSVKEGPTLNLQGRMGMLGQMLNLTKESIYRAMARLEERGDISRKEGLVTLTPPAPHDHNHMEG